MASANVLTTGANAPVVSKNAPVAIGYCPTSTERLKFNINVHCFTQKQLKAHAAILLHLIFNSLTAAVHSYTCCYGS